MAVFRRFSAESAPLGLTQDAAPRFALDGSYGLPFTDQNVVYQVRWLFCMQL
jgi:hypothetical protein